MDWKVIWATCSAIFFAELADKTQLMNLSLTAKSGKPLAVFIGSLCGYTLGTVLSIGLGGALGALLRPELLRYGGGAVFVVIGLLMMGGKL